MKNFLILVITIVIVITILAEYPFTNKPIDSSLFTGIVTLLKALITLLQNLN